MECKHERLRCTDNRFFCLDCGAEVTPAPRPKPPKEPEKPKRQRKVKANG